MNNMIQLNVDRLTKTFFSLRNKPFHAVKSISFELKKGEILGFLGTNGAGKTTTIQMLLGTLTPTSGTIEYFNKNFFTHRSEILQYVAFASTYVRFPGRLTVYENLDFYGQLYQLPIGHRQQKIKELLQVFDMWHIKDRMASMLSAGETTRAMLAKAFLTNPQIVLLDEPTASLDPDIAYEIRHFILKQRAEYNISVLFTSHNMAEVTEVCDRVLVLQKGTIIANNTPNQLAASVSQSRINLLILEQLDYAMSYIKQLGYNFTQEEHTLIVEIAEEKIAQFLTNLASNNISYQQISISKPTLEDYFLRIARASK